MNTIPNVCDECRAYIAEKVNRSASGMIFCHHGQNNTDAGMLAIITVKNMRLESCTLRYPVSETEALALMQSVEAQVEGRLMNNTRAH